MDIQQQRDIVQEQFLKGAYRPPSSVEENLQEATQLIRVLTDHEPFLNILKQELRGEQLYQDSTGESYWVQTDRPMFILLDKNNQPIKILNSKTGKEEYAINEDAINAVINVIKMSGLNPVAPLTNINEDEIRADLLEIESKIAVLLTVKRKKWGIDKAEYPIIVGKLKVIIKDARYRAKDGAVLRALRTITSRIEQTSEQNKPKRITENIPSPFK